MRPFLPFAPAPPPPAATPTPTVPAATLAEQIIVAGQRRRGELACAMPEQPPPQVVADPVALGKAIVAAAKKARSAT
jgi:hypothetical protein